jgi:ATP-binding cassette subfamily C (CFTR/MRP) protein 1
MLTLAPRFYVATTRQTKRLESITRSPIYSHFSETMTGVSTISAFSREEDFMMENRRRIEDNQRCYHASIFVGKWSALRLELIGTLLVVFVALFTIVTRGSVNPGSIGLCLSYALNISSTLQVLTRNLSDIETNLVSVERIAEYQEVVQEAPYRLPENRPPAEWPQHGVVRFEGYSARYRDGLDLVLRGLDLTIRRGEKVGIVGRTGAGKSSFTLALFRMVEAAEGSIYIGAPHPAPSDAPPQTM